MKSGFLSSVGLHALALAIAFISFNAVPKPLENQLTEALPITLVPLSDQTSVREGDKASPLSDKPAPKPTTKPAVKQDAQNVGDGEVDNTAPLKPKEKPRDVNATQPTAGKPDAKPDIVPPEDKPIETKPDSGAVEATQVKPKAEPLQPQIVENQQKPNTPKPEPVKPEPVKPTQVKPEPVKQEQAKPEPVKPVQEIATQAATEDALAPKAAEPKPEEQKPVEPKPAEPKPAEPKPEAVKPTEQETVAQAVPAEPVPHLPTNNAPVPGARPQPTPKTTERAPTEAPKPPASSQAGEDVADIINNSPQTAMIDRTRTQGGGARRSEDNAGFGASQNIGNQPNLGQTVGNIIKACMDNAWILPPGFTGNGTALTVEARFELSPNGDIIGAPILTANVGDPYAKRTMETTGLSALSRCSPFKGLPPEAYDQWRSIVINLRAPQR